MAELKPGALLFSLGACLVRERERFALLRAEAELRRALEHRERVETEKTKLEAELTKERLRGISRFEERRRLEQQAQRLVEQRLAEVERSSREAKARAALEISALDKEHERRLMEIQLATARARARMIAAFIVLVFATGIATSAAFYFGRYLPEARRADALFGQLRAERARANVAERLYAETSRRNAELARELERMQPARSGDPIPTPAKR